MILGIGTDMTSIPRIGEILEKHGAHYLDRCFTEMECAHVEGAAKGDALRRAAGYAKRWAAKEACAKALGLGFREGIFLKDIAVLNDAAGAPTLALTGGAKERLTEITPEGMTACVHLSISDEPPMALAFVVVSAKSSRNER